MEGDGVGYTKRIEKWMEIQKSDRIYELGSLPPFLLVFVGHMAPIKHRWNQHGLGGDNVKGSCRDVHPGLVSSSQLMGNVVLAEPMEQKIDILNSDFASHWQNLQFGRSCQNSTSPAPMIYQSPVMVPPVYLQGCFPMEAPGRPSSANLNFVTQLMSYGSRVQPVTPLESIDMPRYRGGTGTYLPMLTRTSG